MTGIDFAGGSRGYKTALAIADTVQDPRNNWGQSKIYAILTPHILDT